VNNTDNLIKNYATGGMGWGAFATLAYKRKDMRPEIIRGIETKTGIPQLARLLTERLSGSELNSLLMEVFNKRAANTPPELLLQQYQANRFVQPAGTDMIELLSLELKTLRFLRGLSFHPLELSPAAVLGSCSALATVSQDKIISALRNTEIMADATNSLALHIAAIKKAEKSSPRAKDEVLRFCTVHRHLRTQELKSREHTQHFKIGCMVSSGRDTGSYRFECTHLQEHLLALHGMLDQLFGIKKIRITLRKREGYPDPDRLLHTVADFLKKDNLFADLFIEDKPAGNNYYKGIQFKMVIEIQDREIEIADGGFVNWTQKLLGNEKERLLISGFGLQMLAKMAGI
jgi:hypothetical protein